MVRRGANFSLSIGDYAGGDAPGLSFHSAGWV